MKKLLAIAAVAAVTSFQLGAMDSTEKSPLDALIEARMAFYEAYETKPKAKEIPPMQVDPLAPEFLTMAFEEKLALADPADQEWYWTEKRKLWKQAKDLLGEGLSSDVKTTKEIDKRLEEIEEKKKELSAMIEDCSNATGPEAERKGHLQGIAEDQIGYLDQLKNRLLEQKKEMLTSNRMLDFISEHPKLVVGVGGAAAVGGFSGLGYCIYRYRQISKELETCPDEKQRMALKSQQKKFIVGAIASGLIGTAGGVACFLGAYELAYQN